MCAALHSQNSSRSKFKQFFFVCVTIESQNSFYSFDKMLLLEKSNYENCALALFIRVFFLSLALFATLFAISECTYTLVRVYFLTAIFELYEKREKLSQTIFNYKICSKISYCTQF